MIELVWFAAGAATAASAAVVLVRRRRAAVAPMPTPVAVAPAPVAADAPPAAPPPPPSANGPDTRAFARTFADEIANLASGVEGNAHVLIDAASRPDLVPRAAEGLWQAVRRLRQFHAKLLAFAADRGAAPAVTDLGTLLAGLREELRHMELGVTIASRLPPTLPALRAAHDELHDALLFLCAGLMRLERGARRLSFSAECVYDADDTEVEIEALLEWDEDPERSQPVGEPGAAFVFERDAAQNLLASQGGRLTIEHQPGHAARALVRLPAATAPVSVPAPPPPGPEVDEPTLVLPAAPPRHRYGGVLVLEGDPAVRTMLAQQLKSAGRAVFACADSASARSLLQATPDRFELMVVDRDERLAAGDPLAATVTRLCPDLRVCVLASGDAGAGPFARVHRIAKPFGPHELRTALQVVLADASREAADPGLASESRDR